MDDGARGYDRLLGLSFSSVRGDEVRAGFEVRPELLQPYGLLHGGVLCSVVEAVGTAGATAWLGDRGQAVGTSNHTNFLRAVRAGRLAVRAVPVHQGRSQQLWTVDVHDEQGRLVSRGELRVAHRQQEPSAGTANV